MLAGTSAGSPAALCGELQIGDELVCINGRALEVCVSVASLWRLQNRVPIKIFVSQPYIPELHFRPLGYDGRESDVRLVFLRSALCTGLPVYSSRGRREQPRSSWGGTDALSAQLW